MFLLYKVEVSLLVRLLMPSSMGTVCAFAMPHKSPVSWGQDVRARTLSVP